MQNQQHKSVAAKNRANNLVTKMGASEAMRLLTGNYHSTNQLFTTLLTHFSNLENEAKRANERAKLKLCLAAVWECARYGWRMAAFGKCPEFTHVRFNLSCRRTKVLARHAIKTGARIANTQANGMLEPQ